MRLKITANRGTDATQELNRAGGDESSNQMDSSTAGILELTGGYRREIVGNLYGGDSMRKNMICEKMRRKLAFVRLLY